jgi:hypothetical protein
MPELQARKFRPAVKRLAALLGIGYDDADAIAQAVWLAQDRLCPAYAAWAAYHVVGLRYGRRAAVASAAGALICTCGLLDLDALIKCAVRRCRTDPWLSDALWSSLISDADAVAATAKEMGGLIGLDGDIRSYIRWQFLHTSVEGSLEYILEDRRGAFMGTLLAKVCHAPNMTSSRP